METLSGGPCLGTILETFLRGIFDLSLWREGKGKIKNPHYVNFLKLRGIFFFPPQTPGKIPLSLKKPFRGTSQTEPDFCLFPSKSGKGKKHFSDCELFSLPPPPSGERGKKPSGDPPPAERLPSAPFALLQIGEDLLLELGGLRELFPLSLSLASRERGKSLSGDPSGRLHSIYFLFPLSLASREKKKYLE